MSTEPSAGAKPSAGGQPSSGKERVKRVVSGDIRAASRLMRDLDDRVPAAISQWKQLYSYTGNSYVVGVTGNPGTGKSTIVDALVCWARNQDLRVGVVAVDPSSPFTGGAILGDRIRMQRHGLDPNVFIRSLATRGQLGGLSRSTFDVVCVLDAMGYDYIFVETVGVGQDEVDVMQVAHTSVVVTVPGLGDDIQAIKAGIMEIADILVVNKADRDGSDRTVRDLTAMLGLREYKRDIGVIETIATRDQKPGSGIAELGRAIAARRAIAQTQGAQEQRARLVAHVRHIVRGLLAERAEDVVASLQATDSPRIQALTDRAIDPYSVAEEIVVSAWRGREFTKEH